MEQRRVVKAGAVVGACALLGAAGGIVGSAAAPSGHKAQAGRAHPFGEPGGRMRMRGGPPVHAVAVVPNKAGNGFDTVTQDNGSFKSLNGDQLTITDGTKTLTYQDRNITVSAKATVLRNGAKAQLSELRSGDRVHVSQSSAGETFVFAEDAAHQASDAFPGRFHRFERGGPDREPLPPPGGAPLPPPGM